MSDPDDRDLLAAEYVLGTLDAEERADVAARLGADADLAGAVRDWQERLSPLAEALPGVVPPGDLYGRIIRRLFGPDASSDGERRILELRRRLRLWRGATAGFALLAASLTVWVALRESPFLTPEAERLTAVLEHDAGAPAMLLDVDLRARRLTIRPLGAVTPAGKSYQLWIIDPALGAPRSLGLVPPQMGQASLTNFDAAVISTALYAVTLEPVGGSPSGQPTSAPILTGKLIATSP